MVRNLIVALLMSTMASSIEVNETLRNHVSMGKNSPWLSWIGSSMQNMFHGITASKSSTANYADRQFEDQTAKVKMIASDEMQLKNEEDKLAQQQNKLVKLAEHVRKQEQGEHPQGASRNSQEVPKHFAAERGGQQSVGLLEAQATQSRPYEKTVSHTVDANALVRKERRTRSGSVETKPQVHEESESFSSSSTYMDDGHGVHGSSQQVRCVNGDCTKVSKTLSPAMQGKHSHAPAAKDSASMLREFGGDFSGFGGNDQAADALLGSSIAREQDAMNREFAQEDSLMTSEQEAMNKEFAQQEGRVDKAFGSFGSLWNGLAGLDRAAMVRRNRHAHRSNHTGEPRVHSESESFESSYVNDGHGAQEQGQKVSCVDGDCVKVSATLTPKVESSGSLLSTGNSLDNLREGRPASIPFQRDLF